MRCLPAGLLPKTEPTFAKALAKSVDKGADFCKIQPGLLSLSGMGPCERWSGPNDVMTNKESRSKMAKGPKGTESLVFGSYAQSRAATLCLHSGE